MALTSVKRSWVRRALMDNGFDRDWDVSDEFDPRNGAYRERWTNDHGDEVVILWDQRVPTYVPPPIAPTPIRKNPCNW